MTGRPAQIHPSLRVCQIYNRHKKTRAGASKHYHYVFRSGPLFWSSDMPIVENSEGYRQAYDAALANVPKAVVIQPYSTRSAMTRYIASGDFVKLAVRTKDDYLKYLHSFVDEFGEDSIKMFEEKESQAEIIDWKKQWSHSSKMYDYAGTVATLFLNWAMNAARLIDTHHHVGQKHLYQSDRAEIIWLPAEIQALLDVADEREARVVIAACEGGLTPQDIGILKKHHVQRTPQGRRLFFARTKNNNPVAIPVTPALAELIDTTPEDQEYLVVSKTGKRLTSERASQIIRDLKIRANKAADKDESRIHIRTNLRLYDMRGTAATALLRAGCSLNEIAVTMGWGLRHAANIIEKYAALVPEVTDEVLRKLMAARARAEAAANAAENNE